MSRRLRLLDVFGSTVPANGLHNFSTIRHFTEICTKVVWWWSGEMEETRETRQLQGWIDLYKSYHFLLFVFPTYFLPSKWINQTDLAQIMLSRNYVNVFIHLLGRAKLMPANELQICVKKQWLICMTKQCIRYMSRIGRRNCGS